MAESFPIVINDLPGTGHCYTQSLAESRRTWSKLALLRDVTEALPHDLTTRLDATYRFVVGHLGRLVGKLTRYNCRLLSDRASNCA
jgi:hypothetical protein